MRTMRFITKAILLLSLTFGIQQTANAQLGGVLNKAKSAIKNKVKEATGDAKDKVSKEASKGVSKAKTAAVSKALQKALGNAPDCPWVMAENVQVKEVESLVNQLGKMNNEKTKAFAEQIDARAAYDMKIINGMKDGSLPKDEGVLAMAEAEMTKWKDFIDKVADKGQYHGPVNVKKGDQGWFFEGRAQVIIDVKEGIFVTVKNNQPMFCSLGYDGIYLDEEKMKIATEVFIYNLNQATLFENFASKQSNYLDREYNRSLLAAKWIGDAIKYNKPENLEKRARPAAGSMNGTWRAKALALAKQNDSSVTDVVITSSKWDVKTNAFGIPIKRVIYGYVFYKDKNGTKASSRSWAQKHQGGGKYAALANDGVGVETDFYVK